MNINLRLNWLSSGFVKLLMLFCFVLITDCKETVGVNEHYNVLEQPYGLTVEYIRDTQSVVVIDKTPEFAWIVPKSIVKQEAYQILVATSEENLIGNNTLIWDSKKVTKDQSINISYKGRTLEVGETYFWKVRVWGKANKETPYSKVQSFKIGEGKTIITSANSFQIDSIRPKIIKQTSNNKYFIDFGKDAFANLYLNYESKENDTLIIHIGEELVEGKINRKSKGTIRYQEVKLPVNSFKQNYVLPLIPDKRNTRKGAIILPDSIPVLMPFRYAEIENVKGDFDADNVTQIVCHSYWEEEESLFKSSDEVLNQIWDLCKYSIKATTFAGVYVDGDRERIPYEADAYLNQLSHYTTDREYAMARQTIEYFMEYPTWPTEWQLHVALMFHADYMYTGNTELIEKYYEKLKHKTLYELSNNEGLITSENITEEFMFKLGFKEGYKKPLTDIVDWPSAGWGGDPNNLGERDGYVFKKYNTVVNAFYYQNMRIMAEFATIIDKKDDVANFTLKAEKAKKVINKELFDEERGIYIDGIGTTHASLHANMLPLAFGLVPESKIKSVVEFVKSRGIACSVYGAQYLLDGLYNAREAEYALQLMTSKEERSWYNMIREGSTITMEAWGYRFKNNLDWNHAWGAVPANAIPRGLWGIKPKLAGFKVASIKPQLGSLKSSNIIVPTIMGQIKASYSLESNTLKRYTIEIPGNMTAEFEVEHNAINIMHNNEQVKGKPKSLLLKPGINVLELTF